MVERFPHHPLPARAGRRPRVTWLLTGFEPRTLRRPRSGFESGIRPPGRIRSVIRHLSRVAFGRSRVEASSSGGRMHAGPDGGSKPFGFRPATSRPRAVCSTRDAPSGRSSSAAWKIYRPRRRVGFVRSSLKTNPERSSLIRRPDTPAGAAGRTDPGLSGFARAGTSVGHTLAGNPHPRRRHLQSPFARKEASGRR